MKKKVYKLRPIGNLSEKEAPPRREGFSRKSNKEFIQYLFISKSSAAEVQSHLYVALDQAYISQDDFEKVYNQAEVVSKMDSGFIKYLNSQPK